MGQSPWIKLLILFTVVFTIVGVSFVFIVLHHEDGDNRIAFSLTNQNGERVTQKDLSGKSLLVFFGFTSCHDICPTQMSRLTNLMNALDQSGHGQRVTPVFISVDPERDTVEKIALYLGSFHKDFVGLTGTRTALKSTADRFKTLLALVPEDATPGYQLAHSSIVYLVDPYSRVVDFIALAEPMEVMVKRIHNLI